MALDASLNAALQAPAAVAFCALEIVLPSKTIRVLDGAGAVGFDGKVFQGADPEFGTLRAIDPLEEQVGTEAPRARFTFMPRSNNAKAQITNPGVQGSEVSCWFGVVDPATGLVIGQPELLFIGELDEASVDTDKGSDVITFDVASAWDRFFDGNEGARQTDNYQQANYPGDRAFQFITGVEEQLHWGFKA